MTPHNADNSSDGDWDEREDLGWNEFDWARYLREADQEVVRFVEVYVNRREEPEALDVVAHELGWDREDWTEGEAVEDSLRAADRGELFTVHRHPVYLFTRGIYHLLRHDCEAYAVRTGSLPAGWAWSYANALHRGETEAILGIQAVDIGDCGLAICHFKAALSALNPAFSLLEHLPHPESPLTGSFLALTRRHLFHLREVWLRVLRDCREEINFRPPEDGEP